MLEKERMKRPRAPQLLLHAWFTPDDDDEVQILPPPARSQLESARLHTKMKPKNIWSTMGITPAFCSADSLNTLSTQEPSRDSCYSVSEHPELQSAPLWQREIRELPLDTAPLPQRDIRELPLKSPGTSSR